MSRRAATVRLIQEWQRRAISCTTYNTYHRPRAQATRLTTALHIIFRAHRSPALEECAVQREKEKGARIRVCVQMKEKEKRMYMTRTMMIYALLQTQLHISFKALPFLDYSNVHTENRRYEVIYFEDLSKPVVEAFLFDRSNEERGSLWKRDRLRSSLSLSLFLGP